MERTYRIGKRVNPAPAAFVDTGKTVIFDQHATDPVVLKALEKAGVISDANRWEVIGGDADQVHIRSFGGGLNQFKLVAVEESGAEDPVTDTDHDEDDRMDHDFPGRDTDIEENEARSRGNNYGGYLRRDLPAERRESGEWAGDR